MILLMTLRVEVDNPDAIIGAKEQIAYALEHIGGINVLSVKECPPTQMRMEG